MRRLTCGLAAASLVVTACSGGGDNACTRVVSEAIADDSQLHVIVTAEVRYASWPPTSGPHAPGPEPGVYARVLTGPEQVGVLERGDVVIQYSPSVVEERQLTSLLDGDVVLAPGIQLGDAVVATAWGKRISCRSADDLGSIEDFVVDAKDGGPGAH